MPNDPIKLLLPELEAEVVGDDARVGEAEGLEADPGIRREIAPNDFVQHGQQYKK